jgi:hypothetical protein
VKTALLKHIADEYAPLLPSPWVRLKNEFVRRDGPWLQFVSFNASRFDDTYVPRCSFDFLWMRGEVTAGLLVQELKNGAVQRWINTKYGHDAAAVFRDMVNQFRPKLYEPLSSKEIEREITREPNYWPHAFALCLTALSRGEIQEGELRYEQFQRLVADKPFGWVSERRAELCEALELKSDSKKLADYFRAIEVVKLGKLRLPLNA